MSISKLARCKQIVEALIVLSVSMEEEENEEIKEEAPKDETTIKVENGNLDCRMVSSNLSSCTSSPWINVSQSPRAMAFVMAIDSVNQNEGMKI
ncbi:hypothetical protein M8C21_022850 [Ambrosia artemisiifolia]|uniref:Uncharacterized protein n=1 Tax=Ambrosia artemisiifolia TaxID=4212 RepID=A0AAD5DEL0_AMBAR|nr:hypothetical protein M8C21_022850 [Ambrosia artemisiifolia]